MNHIIKSGFALLLPMVFCGSAYAQEMPKPGSSPSVILLIGDGMGTPQISTLYHFGDRESNFSRFRHIGFHESSDASHRITDSAAGATAFAIGEPTYKRALGVNADTVPRVTILETLRDKGYRTGLVTLGTLTHATPAAFYAHVPDRDQHEEIARQLSEARIDFLAGGGRKYFTQRSDGSLLFQRMIHEGYRLDTLQLAPPIPGKRNAYFLAEEGLPAKTEGRDDILFRATRSALDYFEGEGEPFFLMVEGSYIDWAGHREDADMLIEEMEDFDLVLGLVLDYVERNPNTLLLVTADHETGEVSMAKYYDTDPTSGKKTEDPDKVLVRFHSDQHSAELIPVFAEGPGSGLFRGIYPNYQIYHKIMETLGMGDH